MKAHGTSQSLSEDVSQGLTFSVVTPHYGDDRFLQDCIDSVKRQTVQALEHIVVFDGPGQYGPATETSMCLIENGGAAAARNFACQASTGDWILFLDSDDILAEDFIEHCVNFIKANPDVMAIRGVGYNFGGVRDGMRSSNFASTVRRLPSAAGNLIGGPTGFAVRREVLAQRRFENRVFFEDWDLYMQLLLDGIPIAYCSGATFKYRISEAQVTFVSLKKRDTVLSDMRFFLDKYKGKLGPWSAAVFSTGIRFRAYKIAQDRRKTLIFAALHILVFPKFFVLELRRRFSGRAPDLARNGVKGL